MRDHGDALDFDLFDRWRVRLRDVPSSIGWGAVALFLRHLPYDSETMREIVPSSKWTRTERMVANLYDLIGCLFAKDYELLPRPGDETVKRFSTAEAVDATSYDKILARFRGGATDG